MRINKSLLLAMGALLGAAASAHAQAIISSTDGVNTVYLGVDMLGQLNVSGGPAVNAGATGIAYQNATTSGARDATSPGCLCEGWGVSVNGAVSGFANNAVGTGGLTFVSAVSDDAAVSGAPPHGTFVTTTSTLAGLPGISIQQAYTVAVPGALFRDRVTITNTSGATATDVKYVRVMDWDVPFTEFSDVVSIVGAVANSTGSGGNLEFSNDDGFASADPLASNPAALVGGTTNVDFIDSGPADHGGYFKFNFGSLLDGDSLTFDVFYGAAPSEADMLAALATVGTINLYSFGQSAPPSGNPALGTPITYVFGFAGVGDVIVVPPTDGTVPEPATVAVWGGLMSVAGAIAWSRRGKKA